MYTKPLERQHHLEAGLVCSPNSSKCVPLSHFSHFSIHLVQGIPQLHESLLRFREVSKEKKTRTKQKPWIKSSHRRGNKHMNMHSCLTTSQFCLGFQSSLQFTDCFCLRKLTEVKKSLVVRLTKETAKHLNALTHQTGWAVKVLKYWSYSLKFKARFITTSWYWNDIANPETLHCFHCFLFPLKHSTTVSELI